LGIRPFQEEKLEFFQGLHAGVYSSNALCIIDYKIHLEQIYLLFRKEFD